LCRGANEHQQQQQQQQRSLTLNYLLNYEFIVIAICNFLIIFGVDREWKKLCNEYEIAELEICIIRHAMHVERFNRKWMNLKSRFFAQHHLSLELLSSFRPQNVAFMVN